MFRHSFAHFKLYFILYWCLISIPPIAIAQNSLNNMKLEEVVILFEFPSKNVKGSFEQFDLPTRVSLRPEAASNWKARIAVESIKTGNGIRDWHLMSKKYFDRKNHPEMIFSGKSLTPSGGSYLLKGQLTIKGIRKEITLKITPSVDSKNRFTAEGTLNSSDFGIDIKRKREENLVKFRVVFSLRPRS